MPIHRQRLQLRIEAIEEIAPWVRRFVLAAPSGCLLPPFQGGDRIAVQLAEDLWCPFSLTGAPHARDRYEFVVRGKERSRPSSTHGLFHDAAVGTTLELAAPERGLPLAAGPGPHVFIAGGVGLTAFASHIKSLVRQPAALQLHYACHAPMLGLAGQLGLAPGAALRCYVSERGERLDPGSILANLPATAHIYACGPVSLVESVIGSAIAMHWPLPQLHWDAGVRLAISWQAGSPQQAQALSLAA
jgi:ferredoxin-NADP reductase